MAGTKQDFLAAMREQKRAIEKKKAEPSLHERLIVALLDRHKALERYGFPGAYRKLLVDEAVHDNSFDDELDFHCTRRRPDAFVIDRPNRTITAFEVVVSHSVDDEKWNDYLFIALGCHDIGYDLFLVTVDRWGNESRVDVNDALYKLKRWAVRHPSGRWKGIPPPEPELPLWEPPA